ncbi:MAG: hypothetical protein SF123_22160 [Chloroflexota bacterium]|nr:hypothetical protein [Chloroflexota bacterium]
MKAEAPIPAPKLHATDEQRPRLPLEERMQIPITNYSLSTVCPSCGADTYKHACKVRCPRCGFAWDCSEL